MVKKKRLPRSKYNREEITEIFSRLRELRPEPKGELNHVNPFTLVVAVALSAWLATKGVDVPLIQENIEAIYASLVTAYAAAVALFRKSMKDKRDA